MFYLWQDKITHRKHWQNYKHQSRSRFQLSNLKILIRSDETFCRFFCISEVTNTSQTFFQTFNQMQKPVCRFMRVILHHCTKIEEIFSQFQSSYQNMLQKFAVPSKRGNIWNCQRLANYAEGRKRKPPKNWEKLSYDLPKRHLCKLPRKMTRSNFPHVSLSITTDIAHFWFNHTIFQKTIFFSTIEKIINTGAAEKWMVFLETT